MDADAIPDRHMVLDDGSRADAHVVADDVQLSQDYAMADMDPVADTIAGIDDDVRADDHVRPDYRLVLTGFGPARRAPDHRVRANLDIRRESGVREQRVVERTMGHRRCERATPPDHFMGRPFDSRLRRT